MQLDYNFDAQMLQSLVGGLSVLEIPQVNVSNLDQAHEFIRAYGFDLLDERDETKLWQYHRRAVTYLQTELLRPDEKIPEHMSDPSQLKNLAFLLIYASTQDQRQDSMQRWACAILKVMHVMVHLDNDLFANFSTDIQEQTLKPIIAHLYKDPAQGVFLGNPALGESIALQRFDDKPFKTTTSSITKLLAKPEEVAFRVLDKVGVRFVTKHLFDAFRVMRYLVKNNMVSFPHNIPNESNNTLYPVNIFLEQIEQFTHGQVQEIEQIDHMLRERLMAAQERAKYNEKINNFTDPNYRFIKFITRRLVRVNLGVSEKFPKGKRLSFFYPFEVQIVDYDTYVKNLTGPASHEAYKERQRRQARARVLGFTSFVDEEEA